MKKVLIFGGATEGRELVSYGLPAIYCVASDYGAELAGGSANTEIKVGRMDARQMTDFIKENDIACVVDATHPYAREARRNIREASAAAGLPLIRVGRPKADGGEDAVHVKSAAEAAAFLDGQRGSVLLTTGSKELEAFSAVTERKRLFARVLPEAAVIEKCAALGFDAGHLIAMQGPFSRAMNEETLRLTGARWLVTKDGGAPGGAEEKLEAARNCGASVVMIDRPDDDEGCSTAEALLRVRRLLGLERPPLFPMLLDLEGRRAVIAGGGKIAARRAATLKRCGASVTIISPELCAEALALECAVRKKKWEPADLDGAALAVAATDDSAVNARVGAEAKRLGIPVSVADDAAACSFCFPSLVSCGEASVSVSAGALSPSLTRALADRLRVVWDEWVREERAIIREKNSGEQDG